MNASGLAQPFSFCVALTAQNGAPTTNLIRRDVRPGHSICHMYYTAEGITVLVVETFNMSGRLEYIGEELLCRLPPPPPAASSDSSAGALPGGGAAGGGSGSPGKRHHAGEEPQCGRLPPPPSAASSDSSAPTAVPDAAGTGALLGSLATRGFDSSPAAEQLPAGDDLSRGGSGGGGPPATSLIPTGGGGSGGGSGGDGSGGGPPTPLIPTAGEEELMRFNMVCFSVADNRSAEQHYTSRRRPLHRHE